MYGNLFIDVVIKKNESESLRNRKFVAFFGSNPNTHKMGYGRTRAEALGKLVMLYKESFGDVEICLK
jgi:hypothetical protein